MENTFRELLGKIHKKRAKVAVVGLGYVGLPLSIEFAKKGFTVIGIEIDRDRLSNIQKRRSYITDVPAKELKSALSRKRFSASGDFGSLKPADVIIICVPTPLKKKYQPDISFIIQAVKAIAKNIKRPSLVILESTTYPGTTDEIILPLLQKNNFRHGRDFYLAFSPERIDPGNKSYPVNKIPKVVGGVSFEATQLAAAVYRNIVEKVVPVSCARTAETEKLLENTFRLVNIALVDELAMMANKMKIDIWEVIRAASTKPFGFMTFYPGPGVGGHCIPKDPLYLYWKAKYFGFHSRFIKLASEIISKMPEYIVGRLASILARKNIKLKNAKVLIVGVTYKKDTRDLRKSPSLDVIEVLQKKGARVCYFDPLIPYLKIDSAINLKRTELSAHALKSFDCVIIATDHSKVNYDFILKNAKLIFDTRNVYQSLKNRKVIKL